MSRNIIQRISQCYNTLPDTPQHHDATVSMPVERVLDEGEQVETDCEAPVATETAPAPVQASIAKTKPKRNARPAE